MSGIILFAGTSEGRELASSLLHAGREILVCVASEYGEEMLRELPDFAVRAGRMDAGAMEDLFTGQRPELVVDATHPYAAEASRNIAAACEKCGIEYIRLLRPKEEAAVKDPDVYEAADIREAAAFLASHSGRALITTGSRELLPYTEIPNYRERLTVRVLPSEESIALCREAGFDGKHIIAMQGPFSEEMNGLLLRETGAQYLVTKESGKPGGFAEKMRAAKKAGAKVIVIRRPEERAGVSLEEILLRLCPKEASEDRVAEERGEREKTGVVQTSSAGQRTVYLIGAGMGSLSGLTFEAEHAVRQSDVLIGSDRLLAGTAEFGKPVFSSYKSGEILEYLDRHPEYCTAAVLLSGDVGFYSGAKNLLTALSKTGTYQAELICGISSVQYFCAKCGTSWEDAYLMSVHGRDGNTAAAIRQHRKVFCLAGGSRDLVCLSEQLTEYGFGNVAVTVGTNLSYPDERIFETTVSHLAEEVTEGLTVLLFRNPDAGKCAVTCGIPDDAFLRGNVPMTKEEIRALVLSKLRLTKDAVVYDIGAGTGSVAVEAALLAEHGRVYAIERKAEAAELIAKNARHFGVTNLEIVEGEAPEALRDLPSPTHAFIGGSGGSFASICRVLSEKNPEIRIAATAVSLEGIAAMTDYLKEETPSHQEAVLISSARMKELGRYHMMTGMNPVMIAAFGGNICSPFPVS
ncbi:MAG: precorrin-6A reductase [Lachnospiraceae bacterium]|nr:precorrin-6A reductase [Lachnospiraceae bacterium]